MSEAATGERALEGERTDAEPRNAARGNRGAQRGETRSSGDRRRGDANAADDAHGADRGDADSDGADSDRADSGRAQSDHSSQAGESPASGEPAADPVGGAARERNRRRRGRRGRGKGKNNNAELGEAESRQAESRQVGSRQADAGRAESDGGAHERTRDGATDGESAATSSTRAARDNARGDKASSKERREAEERRRRRGSRGGRNRKRGRSERGDRADHADRASGSAPRTRGPIGVDAIPGEDGEDLPQLLELPPDAELLDTSAARAAHDDDVDLDLDAPAPAEGPLDQVIVVNATDAEETRVAVVQDGKIVDLQMTVRRHQSLVNDIYRGRIVNIEAAIGAAFVDFGQGRNGFLHTSDVMSIYGDKEWSIEKLLTTKVGVDEWDEDSSQPDVGEELGDGEAPAAAKEGERRDGGDRFRRPRARPRLPIGDLLHKGQLAVVQVTKDAIGDKGPTLTSYISIPGRYLVLMPCMAKTGVSRKIDDEKERKRLRRILEAMQIPQGMGIIVRTAGVGKTRLELERDLKYLLAIWDNFEKRLRRGVHPSPLYQESDVAIRTMRDLFSPRTEKVVVDNPVVWEHMREFARELMPEHEDKIVLHEGEKPLFHHYGVEQDFERIFSRRVELPSGGSIVFDQAEALVAIDVNSGRTREDGADFEDIALKTNLEAVPEIARQVRLRDLGGIIVIDFIDMLRGSSRKQVEKALRDELASDRARSKLGRISQFGLLELTRQRLGPGLSKLLYDACPHCRGTGRQRTSESRTQAVFRRIASAIVQKGFTTIDVHARPDVVEHLTKDFADPIARLREANPGKELRFTAVPDQMEDSILRYLRTDGKEVRPGGRRRR